MDSKGWVANHDGNITVRLAGGGFAATPTARFKGDLAPSDIIELDSGGKKIAGGGAAFSELSVHLRIYGARREAGAVVHAHPPFATAAGCANQELLTWAMPEAVVSLGAGIPLVGLAMPGSAELWQEFDPLVPCYDAVMVAGNGVFTWGKNLEQAYLRLELVEHLAQITFRARELGGAGLLSRDQVLALLKKRAEAGLGLPDDGRFL